MNGIKEYEALNNECIELTMYRSIGWLGKPDLIRRPGKASGQEFKYVPTPDSQLLNKKLVWHIGLSFSKLTNAEISNKQKDFSTIETYYQNQEYDRFTGPLKYFVSNKWQEKIPKNKKLFKKLEINKNIEISIVKQKNEKELLIRFINHNDKILIEPIKIMDNKFNTCYLSNLLEEKIKKIECKNSEFIIPKINNNQVLTLILERK